MKLESIAYKCNFSSVDISPTRPQKVHTFIYEWDKNPENIQNLQNYFLKNIQSHLKKKFLFINFFHFFHFILPLLRFTKNSAIVSIDNSVVSIHTLCQYVHCGILGPRWQQQPQVSQYKTYTTREFYDTFVFSSENEPVCGGKIWGDANSNSMQQKNFFFSVCTVGSSSGTWGQQQRSRMMSPVTPDKDKGKCNTKTNAKSKIVSMCTVGSSGTGCNKSVLTSC